MIEKKITVELPVTGVLDEIIEARGKVGDALLRELIPGETYAVRLDTAKTEDRRRMCYVYSAKVRAEPVPKYEYPRINIPKQTYLPWPRDVIFNAPATVVFWDDGSKTVVKLVEGEEFNPEVGLAMCFCKKVMGDGYKRWFKDALKKGRWQKEKATKRVEDEKSCESVEQTERRIEEKAREYGDVYRAVREELEETINKKMGEGGER